MNHVTLVGNLTKNPELRGENHNVCTMSLATNRREKVQGEWSTITDFHRIVVFGKRARTCAEHLTKGAKVAIGGRLSSRSFTRDDGSTGTSVEVVASNVQFFLPARGE